MNCELIVDNFAGGGGASTGIEIALGRSVDIAINHDPEAIAMHAANHPTTRHYCESVWDVDPQEVTKGQPVGLAWFSPDCFPAGTLVLTADGYKPIETIVLGDFVMTHKGRWRQVIEISTSVRNLFKVKGHGHPGLVVSSEHPFFVRSKERLVWDRTQEKYPIELTEPRWESASKLKIGDLWATPIIFPVPVEQLAQAKPDFDINNTLLLWLAGRYLADGWTRLSECHSELVISCGKHKANYFRLMVDGIGLAWNERDLGSVIQFSTCGARRLVEWLRRQFGHLAQNKTIPSWVLSLSEDGRKALLDGYVSGDGWHNSKTNHIECSTVSKALAFGIKALACSLGKTVCMYFSEKNTSNIEGREVNALPIWKMRWRQEVDFSHRQTFRDARLQWSAIKKVEDLQTTGLVFNIGVDEDDSYVAEGIVVHNCKHFSKAKGGKPRDQKIRGLAWVALRWAATVKPRIIMLENVEEFLTWGPLVDGIPCPKQKGRTFKIFVNALIKHGYRVEWKLLRACDYGSPTIRKRLFLIARRDGEPIVWPEPTHGDPISQAVLSGRLLPWRTAAECIDWSLPCPSIFERDKPLADATLRRIAKGIQKFVIEAKSPFIVTCNHSGDEFRGQGIDDPFKTLTASRDAHGLVVPTLIQTGYGERAGQAPRTLDLGRPLGTTMGQGVKHALAVATLLRQFGNSDCAAVDMPVGAITANGGGKTNLVVSNLIKLRGQNVGNPIDEPVRTISAGGLHIGEVRAFLMKYYGQGTGASLNEPVHTVTSKDRLGIVTIESIEYLIVDIGMRMLQPHELFLAQGFPDDYVIAPIVNGKRLSKTAQVRMVGNSVCPDVAAALVAANVSLISSNNILKFA